MDYSVKHLSYTAVQLKTHFDPPSKLVCDNELASCIGILMAHTGNPLPNPEENLDDLAADAMKLSVTDPTDEKMLAMIGQYIIKHENADEWHQAAEYAYSQEKK